MKQVLNVAEKPSVAKEVSRILAQGQSKMVESESKYNPVFQFDFKLQQQPVSMLFTSVTGHLVSTKFEDKYKSWTTFNPSVLLDQEQSQIIRYIDSDKKDVERNLLKWARMVDMLILWLDCDREGEAIAYEVIEICNKVNQNLEIKRAWFSSLDKLNITNAINSLREPRFQLSEAVNARIEIDLRIGSAFTVFQTLNLQNSFSSLKEKKDLISYGPCQFPTLGFVVERYNQIQKFVEEKFWSIQPTYQWKDGNKTLNVDLRWNRCRVYDQEIAAALYLRAVEDENGNYNPRGIVVKKNEKEITKGRPFPLTTVDLTKQGCRLLQMGSEKIMKVAEQLYTNGYISYPRTETNKYTESITNIQLINLIRLQKQSQEWGYYADDLVDRAKFQRPKAGKQDDQAHPPIHPVKLAEKHILSNEEWKVYEFITRHFLATCGSDAIGAKTEIEVKFNTELFHVDGLVVKEKNYLEVYRYERWNDNMIPPVEMGQTMIPCKMNLGESNTTPPRLISESELIDKMDKNGIGTDATMQDHIVTIQKRSYAIKNKFLFTPTALGIALCNAYESLNIRLSKPDLRAKMERLMAEVARGENNKKNITNEIMEEMKEILKQVEASRQQFILIVGQQLHEQAKSSSLIQDTAGGEGGECGNCGNRMEFLLNSVGSRNLFCTSCDRNFNLPKNGIASFRKERCEICKFQIVEIKTDQGSTYAICPNCYNQPPPEFFENIPSNENEQQRKNMPCYRCVSRRCPLSGRIRTIKLFDCHYCSQPIVIKEPKQDKKQFIGCTGYPKCIFSAFFPKDIISVLPSEEECIKCSKQNRVTYLVEVKYDEAGQYDIILGLKYICFYPSCNLQLGDAGIKVRDLRNHNGNNNNNNAKKINDDTYQEEEKNQKNMNDGDKNNNNGGLKDGGNQKVCLKCNQPGHKNYECIGQKPKKKQSKKKGQDSEDEEDDLASENINKGLFAHLICNNCGSKGHLTSKCTNPVMVKSGAKPIIKKEKKSRKNKEEIIQDKASIDEELEIEIPEGKEEKKQNKKENSSEVEFMPSTGKKRKNKDCENKEEQKYNRLKKKSENKKLKKKEKKVSSGEGEEDTEDEEEEEFQRIAKEDKKENSEEDQNVETSITKKKRQFKVCKMCKMTRHAKNSICPNKKKF